MTKDDQEREERMLALAGPNYCADCGAEERLVETFGCSNGHSDIARPLIQRAEKAEARVAELEKGIEAIGTYAVQHEHIISMASVIDACEKLLPDDVSPSVSADPIKFCNCTGPCLAGGMSGFAGAATGGGGRDSSDPRCTCTWTNIGNANTTRRERIAIGCVVHSPMALDPHVIVEHGHLASEGKCVHGVTLKSPCMTCISRGDDPRGPTHGREHVGRDPNEARTVVEGTPFVPDVSQVQGGCILLSGSFADPRPQEAPPGEADSYDPSAQTTDRASILQEDCPECGEGHLVECSRASVTRPDKATSIAPSITVDEVTYSPGDIRIMRDAAQAAEHRLDYVPTCPRCGGTPPQASLVTVGDDSPRGFHFVCESPSYCDERLEQRTDSAPTKGGP